MAFAQAPCYVRAVDQAARRKLVDEHMSLVRALATKVKRNLLDTIEFDDLVSYGTQGLLEAAERFDEKYQVTFVTFAYYRVRGAIYDGLRKMGHVPRGQYERIKAVSRANEYLQNLSDRETGAAEARTAPGKSSTEDNLREMYEAMRSVATVFVTSLESMTDKGLEFVEPQELSPEEKAHLSHAGQRVRKLIAALPDKERHFIEKHYFEDKSLAEAGQELGLSKSWASRLHARAVEMLRERLSEGS